MKFRERLARFMYGRYGADQLSNFVLWTYIVLYLLNLIAQSFIIYIGATALMIWSFFRMFSRNIYARNQENLKFLALKKKFKSFWKLLFDKVKDSPKKVYKKCPSCKAIVRLPRKRGKHSVTCPKCQRRFKVKIMPFWLLVAIVAFCAFALAAALTVLIVL